MTAKTLLSTFGLLLPALLVLGVGCSAPDADGDRDGGNDGEGARDTSDYEGRLAWSKATRLGVFVWDLPNSEYVFEYEPELGNFATSPSLSADGSTLAYAREHSVVLTASLSNVELRDLNTGERVEYTSDGLGPNQIRVTTSPSLSADGKRVAVAEAHADLVDDGLGEMPTNATAASIEVWDRTTDTRIRVTDGTEVDTLPLLSADGKRVLFISTRDEAKGDFYIGDVEENATVERLSFTSNDNIRDLNMIDIPGRLAASADLTWVVFMAVGQNELRGDNYFLMNTTTGSVEHLDIQPSGFTLSEDALLMRKAVDISADGSTLVFSIHFMDASTTPLLLGQQVLVARRETPTTTTVAVHNDSSALLHGIGISADGSDLAYARSDSELWVSRADGSNPKVVASKKEERVGPDFAGTMTLSF